MWRILRDRLFGHDVFVSYSSNDRSWAAAIVQILRFGKYDVFFDESGLDVGDHLDRLLAEVRRSTMFTVLVSDHSMQSNWVYAELQAHLERPRRQWRIAPIFLDPRYPRDLPERFRVLGEFHGTTLPAEKRERILEVTEANVADHDDARALQVEMTSQFRASRKATWQRAASSALVALIISATGGLFWTIQRNAERDALLRRAAVASAAARFDEAEVALAEAYQLDSSDEILAAYRESRSRRAIERPSWIDVARQESVLAADGDDLPYVVIHTGEESDDLVLFRGGRRTLMARACSATPMVVTRGPLVGWVCGARLGAMVVGDTEPRDVPLPAAPERVRLVDDHVELAFRERGVAQVGVFQVPSLEPTGLRVLDDAPSNGELGLCPNPGQLAWAIEAKDGRIIVRRWDVDTPGPRAETFAIPVSSNGEARRASWISRVFAADDCERFFVEYAVLTTAARSTFEVARIRLQAVRPFDLVDGRVTQLVPSADETRLEAIYLTESKELRALLLTSPVVLDTTARTLASEVHRMSRWLAIPGETWVVALGREEMSIYRNQALWSRHPSDVGDPIRAVPSPDGRWIVVEGDSGAILWRRAEPWDGAEPPNPEEARAATMIPLRPHR